MPAWGTDPAGAPGLLPAALVTGRPGPRHARRPAGEPVSVRRPRTRLGYRSQPTHTVVRLQNSRMPWADSSQPLARPLDASEGEFRQGDGHAVDEDLTGLQVRCEPVLFGPVVGPALEPSPKGVALAIPSASLLRGERADIGLGVGGVSDREGSHPVDEFCVNDESLGGDAGLPVVLCASRHGSRHSTVQVRRRHDLADVEIPNRRGSCRTVTLVRQ